MVAVAEVVEGLSESPGIVEEVAEDDYQPAAGNPLGDVVEDIGQAGLAARLGALDLLQQEPHLAGARAGGEVAARLRVEGDQPGRVLLADEQVGQGGGQVLRVGELGERASVARRRRVAAVGHRAGGVEQHRGAQVGLLDVLLDVEPVRAGEDAPVEVARIVARRVGAVLGELDREPLVRALVAARDKALHGAARQQFEAPDGPHALRRQQPHVGGGGHAWPSYSRISSAGRIFSSSCFTMWSLVTPAASALNVVSTRCRSTGRATWATSAVVA